MNVRFLALSAAVASAVAFGAPKPADAADTLTNVKAKHTIVIGVRQDSAPYGYLAHDRYLGIEPDLAHHIARDLLGNGNDVTFIPVTAGNRFQFLQTGKVDILMATVSVTPDRKDLFSFSVPYARTGWTLLVPAKGSKVAGIDDLAGHTVAVVRHTTSDTGIDKLAPNAKKVAFETSQQAEEALRSGTVDAFAENVSMLNAVAKKDHAFAVVKDSYENVGIAAACVKNDDSLCAYVTQEVQKYALSGQLRNMYHGWVGKADTDRFYPRDPLAAAPR